MSFLEDVTAERRADAKARAERGAIAAAERAVVTAFPPRDFRSACLAPPLKLIAEVKRASPSKGPIAPDADACVVAGEFERGGAAAISVLTEERHFGGSLDDLRAVAAQSSVPVLRKDFICEPLHVLEARGAGADAVLLIVAALLPGELAALIKLTTDLGMTADVEVHAAGEVAVALDAGATVIAINARNLATLAVDLAQIERVRPLIPDGVATIAESGIATSADVKRMRDAGVDAVHIGELLMRAENRSEAVRALLG